MKTKLFTTSEKDIHLAAKIISAGGIVAFPTETVYGLGADAMNPAAARAVYHAKGRPSDNPLIVHISKIQDLASLALDIPSSAYALADHFWPGPLTIVLCKKHNLPDTTTGGLETVAIRMPDNEVALRLIAETKTFIAAPSANVSGRPSPTTWTDVKEDMDGRIDGIIMGQPCLGGIESTVLDLSGHAPVILRPGLITPEAIESVLGQPVIYDPGLTIMSEQNIKAKSPGMKYRHYSPRADMVVFCGENGAVKKAIEERRQREEALGKKVGVLLYEQNESKIAAREFFARLREMDRTDVSIILAAALPTEDSLSFSVMNRMFKAAGYRIEEV